MAHLLVHGTLPNQAGLAAYKAKLKALRGLPAAVRAALECLPAAAHPMMPVHEYVDLYVI